MGEDKVEAAGWQPRRLSKSRFVTGVGCGRKLFYGGQRGVYPAAPSSEFLMALAKGGYQVGELAKVLYGPGVEVEDLREDVAVQETAELMQREEVTIFEGAYCVPEENLLIRADVLHKRGRTLQLIEVKAKSWDPECDKFFKARGRGIASKWERYLLDVAFQQYVLERCFPGCAVNACLLLVDKSAVCTVDGLHQRFLARNVKDEHTGRIRLRCEDRKHPAAEGILVEVPVAEEVAFLRTEWRDGAGQTFGELVQELASICGDGRKTSAELGSKCRDCEFRVEPADLEPGEKSGFLQCWGERWQVEPSEVAKQPLVLDLWNNRGVAGQLERGAWRLRDLAGDYAWPVSGPLDTGLRQAVQVHVGAGLQSGPFVDANELCRRVAQVQFPLHLIDFETATVAIPFMSGRRPYEVHAFQFSHHVLHEDGRLEHFGEWLDDEVGTFPNYRFLRALRSSLGEDKGTLVHYAAHENTVLNQIRDQLLADSDPPADRDELVGFVEYWATASGLQSGWAPKGRRLDLREWVLDTFYDASMNGSYSIKAVLPAVFENSALVERRFGKPVYGAVDGIRSRNFTDKQWFQRKNGRICDPYKLLPPVFPDAAELGLEDRFFDQAELREGGSASTAYARLQFEDMGVAERVAIRQALLRYCELDTLAMAIIFEHLRSLAE